MVTPAILGALAACGLAPWHLYPLTLAALAGLVSLWRTVGPARAAWRGLVFAVVYCGVGLYGDHGLGAAHLGQPGPVVAATILIRVAGPACCAALTGAIAAATRRLAAPVWALAVVPAAWGLCELAQAQVLGGLPRLSLGYVLLAAPVEALAPLIGVPGQTLALVLAAGTLWLLYAGALPGRLTAAVLIAVLPLLLWLVPPPQHWTRPATQPIRVAVLPGTAANRVAATIGPKLASLARYRAMTRRSDADLVIWPASAATRPAAQVRQALLHQDGAARQRDQAVVADLTRPAECTGRVVLGVARPRLIPCREPQTGVDFEPPTIAMLRAHAEAASAAPLVVHSHGVAIGLVGEAVALPAAGMLVANKGTRPWHGLRVPFHSLQAARMHALEAGRPLVWAAQDGGSALVSFDGRVLDAIRPGRAARLVATITPRRGLTPYANKGDWLLWWATSAVVLAALLGALLRYCNNPAHREKAAPHETVTGPKGPHWMRTSGQGSTLARHLQSFFCR